MPLADALAAPHVENREDFLVFQVHKENKTEELRFPLSGLPQDQNLIAYLKIESGQTCSLRVLGTPFQLHLT